jgi:5'-deoxynucleotidase YfbR-like HD superfamily hydrolase
MENSIVADVLDEDKPIANQKFVCLSFLSPEKILKQKEMYYFDNFVKNWDYSKSIEHFNAFISFIGYKYGIDAIEIQNDFKEFIKSEQDKYDFKSILDDYKNFLDHNEEALQDKFNIENKFKTNVRGIKIRGSFNTQEEAELRAKNLREFDPSHDVFVGQVGMWMPFDPDAYKTGNVQYLENELNDLMHEKIKNESEAKNEFEERIKKTKEKAIEENIKKAQESGNVLSQVMDKESGELTNVRAVDWDSIPDDEVRFDNEITKSNNIKKEIFDKSNIK